jgi:integrase
MGSIQDRRKLRDRTTGRRKDTGYAGKKPWRVRYLTPEGDQRSASFPTKVEAERFLHRVEASKLDGDYVDPARGRVSFGEHAESWRAAQVHRPTTAAQVETHLRKHVIPTFGERPIGSIKPSEVQAWVKSLEAKGLAPSTIEVIYRYLVAIFRAAVEDAAIKTSPVRNVKLPRIEKRKLVPLTVEEVWRLVELVPPRYRALVLTAAGTGLRQGEIFGLSLDRVDFLRRALTVDRQLVLLPGGGPAFAPPKTDASYRDVPLPDLVLDALSAHIAEYEPGDLIFTNDAGEPIRRTRFSDIWRPAVAAAQLKKGTVFHDLRHHYASLLIRHGESVKTVQARLGHASAKETLDTYAHIWPDSEDRTRAAVDELLGQPLSAVANG